MNKVIFFLMNSLFAAHILLAVSCSEVAEKSNPAPGIVLVASTPGDPFVKCMLHIDAGMDLDFIRWNLTIGTGAGNSNTWLLDIFYGKSQPNTLGFAEGGLKRTFQGKYTVTNSQSGDLTGKIYQLKSDQPDTKISLFKLNDNLFHLLAPDNRLLAGNGGWSYTLNRQDIQTNLTKGLPSPANPSFLLNDTAQQVIFEGRTPCQELAKEYNLPVSGDCFKKKWRLTLYRAPGTLLPDIYNIKRGNNPENDIVGKWAIIEGTETNPDAVIYQLDPDQPDKSIYFLAGSENVLFFLDRNQQLLTGNADFSFTLNKKPDNSGAQVSPNLSNLFKLSDAERILGETAHLKDSVLTVKSDTVSYKCSYIADSEDQKAGKTGAIYVMFEDYKELASAKKVYASIWTSNKNHQGIKVLEGVGDEAYFHSDGQNFYFILVRKGGKILRMKVNKITSKTSLDEFNQVARNITVSL
jgi:hypothetical protein